MKRVGVNYVRDTGVEPRFKTMTDCPCGCGLNGTLKNDRGKHVRGCKCRSCMGRRVKRASGGRERAVAKRLGGTRSPLSGGLSGFDIEVPLRGGSRVLIEETTNAAFCRGLNGWWANKGTQTKLARLLAQRDGLRAVFTPELVVMPRVDAEALLQIAGASGETTPQ